MANTTHCIARGYSTVCISTESLLSNWKVQTPNPNRKDYPDDYVVSCDEQEDTITVSASVVDSLLKSINAAISPIELAVLIAKVNFDRFTYCTQSTHDSTPEDYFNESAIETVSSDEIATEEAEFMHVESSYKEDANIILDTSTKNGDYGPPEFIKPYDFLSENDICDGLSCLFMNLPICFDEIFEAFSELTPQQVETILLAREPQTIFQRYW